MTDTQVSTFINTDELKRIKRLIKKNGRNVRYL